MKLEKDCDELAEHRAVVAGAGEEVLLFQDGLDLGEGGGPDHVDEFAPQVAVRWPSCQARSTAWCNEAW